MPYFQRVLILPVIVLMQGCDKPKSAERPKPGGESQAGVVSQEEGQVIRVSMVQLLAAPERFDGRRVRVQGVMKVGNEERALYLSRDDAEFLNLDAGIWLDTRETRTTSGFVIVEGTFDAGGRGHQDLWAAEIRNITKIERALGRADYPSAMVK